MRGDFAAHYGPWALVAGASEGLGAEYARQLAARGLSVLLLARRAEPMAALAEELQQRYGVAAQAAVVDLVHWWGRNFDPALMARPVWWRATIWIDALFFGPYYAVALYAFIKGRRFIRLPSLVWASVMMTNVTIILFEEMIGPHATPARGLVLLVNAPWFLFPLLMLWRMGGTGEPFARRRGAPSAEPREALRAAAETGVAGGAAL